MQFKFVFNASVLDSAVFNSICLTCVAMIIITARFKVATSFRQESCSNLAETLLVPLAVELSPTEDTITSSRMVTTLSTKFCATCCSSNNFIRYQISKSSIKLLTSARWLTVAVVLKVCNNVHNKSNCCPG